MAGHGKNISPLSDGCTRERRLKKHPINIKGDYIIVDRLEIDGTLKLFEYLGGPMYTPFNPERMENVALVASAKINLNHQSKEVRMGKVNCNYGYDFWGAMIRHVLQFADFYGYSVALLNLKKGSKVDTLD